MEGIILCVELKGTYLSWTECVSNHSSAFALTLSQLSHRCLKQRREGNYQNGESQA